MSQSIAMASQNSEEIFLYFFNVKRYEAVEIHSLSLKEPVSFVDIGKLFL